MAKTIAAGEPFPHHPFTRAEIDDLKQTYLAVLDEQITDQEAERILLMVTAFFYMANQNGT